MHIAAPSQIDHQRTIWISGSMHPNGWVDHLYIGKWSFLCPRVDCRTSVQGTVLLWPIVHDFGNFSLRDGRMFFFWLKANDKKNTLFWMWQCERLVVISSIVYEPEILILRGRQVFTFQHLSRRKFGEDSYGLTPENYVPMRSSIHLIFWHGD